MTNQAVSLDSNRWFRSTTSKAIALGAVLLGISLWWYQPTQAFIPDQVRQAEELSHGAGRQALQAVAELRKHALDNPKLENQLDQIEAKAAASCRDIWTLLSVHDRNSNAAELDESAALLVARAALHSKELEKFQKTRVAWQGRETQQSAWLGLDSDALLLSGEKQRAIDLLKSRTLPPHEDCSRLTRLAILHAKSDPDLAWEYLDQAFRKNPKNSDVRLFRAQILEAKNRHSHARVEYVAAFVAQPNNKIYRDSLAEFYRRRGRYRLALRTWCQGDAAIDSVTGLRVAFWQRVATGDCLPIDWPKRVEGPLHPLVNFLAESKDEWWNEKKFSKLADGRNYLASRQELFWLKLIDALDRDDIRTAADLLKRNAFKKRSWSPSIEAAISSIIDFRLSATGFTHGPKQVISSAAHRFLQCLSMRKLEISSVGEAGFLKSRQAWAAAFLADGWFEVAVKLQQGRAPRADSPDWFAYGMTQALRVNRSIDAAIKFADELEFRSAEVDLLVLEMRLSRGEFADIKDELTDFSRQRTPAGARAAWLLGMSWLAQKETQKLRDVIAHQPFLKGTVIGQELLAKAELVDGNRAAAIEILAGIADESAFAKSQLANAASQLGDHEKANRLTTAILKENPDALKIRKHLTQDGPVKEGSQ